MDAVMGSNLVAAKLKIIVVKTVREQNNGNDHTLDPHKILLPTRAKNSCQALL